MKKNTWKKIAAGAMALTMVAGQTVLPAGLGGLFTGGTAIVASAEESSYTFTATGDRISNYTCNSSDNKVSLSADYIYKIANGSGPSVYRVNSTGSKVVINSTGTIKSVTAVVNSQVDMGLNASGGTKSQNDHTYTISDVNASSLTLTGASPYGTGITSITVTYAEKVSLTAAEVEAVTTTYTGSALTPTIKIGDTTLTNGTDYTYEVYDTATPSDTDEPISNPTNAGTYYVKVTGIGGYTGEKTVEWVVDPFDLSTASTPDGSASYNGRSFVLRLNLENVTFPTADYQYTATKDGETVSQIKDAGVYNITYTGTDTGNLIGEMTTTLTVTKIDPTADLFNFTAPENLYSDGTAKTATIVPKTNVSGMGEITKVLYTKDGEAGSETETPTDAGTYKAYVYTSEGVNYKSGDALTRDDWTFTIQEANVLVTVPEGAVIEGQEATDGIYTLECGNTYVIYSDETLNPSDAAGLDISTANDKEYDGKTYNYKYTVAFADTIANGTEIEFAHKHAAKAFSTDETHADTDKVWVYCEGEPSAEAACVAELKTDGTYYYGDAPTADDVNLSEYFGATAEVTDFFFTKKGDTTGSHVSEQNMVIGETYVVNATIAVTIDNRVSNIAITREIEFAARPLEKCDVYYIDNAGDEVLIDKSFWNEEYNSYQLGDLKDYDGTERQLQIIVRNPSNGEELVLDSEYSRYPVDQNWDEETAAHFADNATDADWYWTGFSAPETVGEETNNYSGSFSVSWGIGRAEVQEEEISIDYNGKVYDGEALDKDDFTFAAAENQDDSDRQQLISDLLADKDTMFTILPQDENDLTSAGMQNIRILIENPNFQAYEYFTEAEISKRSVKVTPADDQSMIYGTEEAPAIRVTTEQATDADGDGEWDTKTGVIPADAETVDFSPAVDIVDFDYRYFVNNAATYSYKISDVVLDNYTVILDGTAVFTVEPKQLTADMFDVDTVDYTFDGTSKNAPLYSFGDGIFPDHHTEKLTDADFTEGGTDHAVLPGSYTLEFSGQGNYTGYVTFDWEIAPVQEYAIAASVEDKTYDGKPVVPTSYLYRAEDADKTEVTTIKGVKTTYTYYAINGDELTKLDGAPKDAGFYRVEVSKTAKGYTFDNCCVDFKIAQKEIAITPNASGKIFGDTEPDRTDFSYDESAVIDGDTLTFSGEYGLDDYAGNVGTYTVNLGTVAVDSANYFLTIAGSYTVAPQELTDANIVVYKDCTVTEDGWWYPGDCIKVTGTVDGKEIELVRPVYDDSTNTYTNTDFAFTSATKTKKTGAFSVQIEGVGNYTGFAEATVNVRNADYDHQAAVEAGIGVDLADAVLKDGTKARFVLTPSLADGWTVEAYGIVYDKTGKIKDADAAKSGLVLDGDYVTKTCSATSGTAYALNITPTNNNTIWAVGYITVSNGSMSTTIYTEPKSGNVDDLKAATEADIEANVNVSLADAVLKDGSKARFVLTPTIADGWTVNAYGIVYDKTGKIKDADAAGSGLVLGGSYVTKTCTAKDGTAYALNITPTNNNTIWAVGYITVTKDGLTKTIYTEPKSANVTEMQIGANVKVSLADAVLKDGTKARFVLTPSIADGWTVDAYGIVYDKTGAVANAEEAKSGLVLGGSYVTKTCSTKDGTAYALNITPVDDKTIWAVGYITVTKDGVTKTIYTAPKSAKVSELN